jgi:hypothetical protein
MWQGMIQTGVFRTSRILAAQTPQARELEPSCSVILHFRASVRLVAFGCPNVSVQLFFYKSPGSSSMFHSLNSLVGGLAQNCTKQQWQLSPGKL